MLRQISLSIWLLCVLAISAMGLTLWGWVELADRQGLTFLDAVYHSLTVLMVDEVYFKSAEWENNIYIEVGRWLGIAAFILATSKAITALLARQIEYFKARLHQNHLVIIGDSEAALELAETALGIGEKVTWLSASESQAAKKAKHLFVTSATWHIRQYSYFGIYNASAVAVMTTDSVNAYAIGRHIRQQADNKALNIFILVKYPWLAMRMLEMEGITGIQVFSQNQAEIRHIHKKHPPFLIAKKLNQQRIHSVIIGFGLCGEAILLDTLLSCLTTYLEKPLVTIMDPKAGDIKNSLKLRYPELEKSVDIQYIEKTVEGNTNTITDEELLAIAAPSPLTAVYICLSVETLSLSIGLSLQALAQRHAWTQGPIFVRLPALNALPQHEAGIANLSPAQLIGFGKVSHFEDIGILNEDSDILAKAMHTAYNQAVEKDNDVVPWENLSEDKRDANRRFLMHIDAKLSSAGIEIETWIKNKALSPEEGLLLPSVDMLTKDEATLERLGELEHERWMADRRINGWCYRDQAQDSVKRFHPDLIPYAQLDEATRDKDRLMIRNIIDLARLSESIYKKKRQGTKVTEVQVKGN